jgi:hypothetical protein
MQFKIYVSIRKKDVNGFDMPNYYTVNENPTFDYSRLYKELLFPNGNSVCSLMMQYLAHAQHLAGGGFSKIQQHPEAKEFYSLYLKLSRYEKKNTETLTIF